MAAGTSRDKIEWMGSSCRPPNLLPRRRQARTNSPVPGLAPCSGGPTVQIPLRHLPESLRCVCGGQTTNSQKKQQSGKICPQQDGSLNPEHRPLPLRRAQGRNLKRIGALGPGCEGGAGFWAPGQGCDENRLFRGQVSSSKEAHDTHFPAALERLVSQVFKAICVNFKSPGSTTETRWYANQGKTITKQGAGWRTSLPPVAPASCYITEPEGENHISNVIFKKDNVKTTHKPPQRSFSLGQGTPKGGTYLDSIKSIKHLSFL